MFVFNCKIVEGEQLKVAKCIDEKAKAKKKNLPVEFETYKPVECEICHSEVGVYDERDEIYYFFNILASHS